MHHPQGIATARRFEAVGKAAAAESEARPVFSPRELKAAFLSQPGATVGSYHPNDHCFNWTNGGVTAGHTPLFLRIGTDAQAEAFEFVGRRFNPPLSLAVNHRPRSGLLVRVCSRLDRTPIDGIVSGPDDGAAGLVEGHKRSVTLDVSERSGTARTLCIELARRSHPAGKLACRVCGDVMSDLYGDVAEDLIHVHHVHPLADRTGSAETDPATDLVCVCPNCHAVIHHRGVCRTVEEVRAVRRIRG